MKDSNQTFSIRSKSGIQQCNLLGVDLRNLRQFNRVDFWWAVRRRPLSGERYRELDVLYFNNNAQKKNYLTYLSGFGGTELQLVRRKGVFTAIIH